MKWLVLLDRLHPSSRLNGENAMGIYDREYYQSGSGGFSWGFFAESPAVRGIIAVNVTLFLVQLFLGSPEQNALTPFERWFALDYAKILQGFQIHRLITYAFLTPEFGLFVVLFSSLILWFFGPEIERRYGTGEFLAFYLTACLLGSLVQLTTVMLEGRPDALTRGTGPSSAIAALIVAATLIDPKREVMLMLLIRIPMWIIPIVMFGFDILNLIRVVNEQQSLTTSTLGLHLAGAAYAFAFYRLDMRWSRLLERMPRGRSRRLLKARIYRPDPEVDELSATPHEAATAPPAATEETAFEARVDQVLTKIAREGRDALSKDEVRLLEEASRRAKSRRRPRS